MRERRSIVDGEFVLETSGLTKEFGSRRAVDHLNLHVREGDIYGFLGPNGAGKSTTIRMLTGLIRPTSGHAKVLNLDIRTQRTAALKEIGTLIESPAFYRYLSAKENLRILGKLSGGCEERRIDRVLETVGLLERAGDRVGSFSHGMNQRLGIAQALLSQPRLLILDEPMDGLDPQGVKDVRTLIVRLAAEEGTTVFISSHLLHEVEQICTRVGVLNRGKLVAEGAVDQLLGTKTGSVEIRVGGRNLAASVLAGLPNVEVTAGPHEVEGGRYAITFSAEERELPIVSRALVNAGVDLYSIRPVAASLEELFLKLVREAEDDR